MWNLKKSKNYFGFLPNSQELQQCVHSVRDMSCVCARVCLPGVTVLAVGVDQANTEELRRAVTDGSPQNVLYARDASQLDTVHSDLADLLCGIARIPDVRKITFLL